MSGFVNTLRKHDILHLTLLGIALVFFLLFIIQRGYGPSITSQPEKKINALMMLIEFEQIDGIRQWEKELDRRGLSAIINVQGDILQKYPDDFKRLADKGYEIAGVSSSEPFWDKPYEYQYEKMKETKDFTEKLTGKEMRVFGSTYFAYDENTLKVADALGVEYILGRGTRDIEAVIYAPEEYQAKVISVSNVDVGEPMGRGSLCDYSLWARGASPEEFGEILSENIAKNPKNMILVSHAYLGGTRQAWWNQYQQALSSPKVSWNSFDNWIEAQQEISLPNSEIPLNTEVNYSTPQPEKSVNEYEPIGNFDGGVTDNDFLNIAPSSAPLCQ